jgi:hypothetical protein
MTTPYYEVKFKVRSLDKPTTITLQSNQKVFDLTKPENITMIKNSDDNTKTTIDASTPNTPNTSNTPNTQQQPVEKQPVEPVSPNATGSPGSMMLSDVGDVDKMKTILQDLNERIMNYENTSGEGAKLRTEIKEIFKTSPPGKLKMIGQLKKPSPKLRSV